MFFRFKICQEDENKGYYFIRFTPDVTEAELQKLLPILNKTQWYESQGISDLLTFQFKKHNSITRTKQGLILKLSY